MTSSPGLIKARMAKNMIGLPRGEPRFGVDRAPWGQSLRSPPREAWARASLRTPDMEGVVKEWRGEIGRWTLAGGQRGSWSGSGHGDGDHSDMRGSAEPVPH